jgi:hypothetical protein
VLSFTRAIDHPRGGAVGQTRKPGFKPFAAMSMMGRRSKKRVDWTRTVAIFSTIVTLSLVALYMLQDHADF